MTNRQAADERLRAAFQAIGASTETECSDEEIDRIWRAVSGELPPAERRALVERTAANAACAEAWRVAWELWAASRTEAPAMAGGRGPRREEAVAIGDSAVPAPSWTPAWLAAAALVLSGIGVGLLLQFDAPAGGLFRDPGVYAVEPLVPADATLPRDGFRLRWTPGPEGSRYQVTVTTEDLHVLTTAADLALPEFLVEREQLSGVVPGARVLWQVDVMLPGGRRVSSETFVARAP